MAFGRSPPTVRAKSRFSLPQQPPPLPPPRPGHDHRRGKRWNSGEAAPRRADADSNGGKGAGARQLGSGVRSLRQGRQRQRPGLSASKVSRGAPSSTPPLPCYATAGLVLRPRPRQTPSPRRRLPHAARAAPVQPPHSLPTFSPSAGMGGRANHSGAATDCAQVCSFVSGTTKQDHTQVVHPCPSAYLPSCAFVHPWPCELGASAPN